MSTIKKTIAGDLFLVCEDESTVEVDSLSKSPLDREILAPSPCFNLSKANLHTYSARKMGDQLPK